MKEVKMESLKEKYDEVLSQETSTELRINSLKDNAAVKEYLALQDKIKHLQDQKEELYRQIQFDNYSSCKHIWTITYVCYEEGCFYCGCIKCGLDQRVVLPENYDVRETPYGQIMEEFVKKNCGQPMYSKLECDLPLARAIYAKIKEAHPNIDDKTALSYLNTALSDIRDKKVSDKRRISRAKRLSLRPNYSKWNWDQWYLHHNGSMK